MGTSESVDVAGAETGNGAGVDVAESTDAAPAFAAWNADENIYMRLLRARAEAKRMEKKGKHEVRKDGKKVGEFGYILGDDITQEANRLFVKYGICPLPTAIERSEEPLGKGLKTTIKCELKCVNVDKPDESVTFEAWGTGIDYSDKGDGKAYSYAVKYATAKALGLNTSDDIEEHDAEYESRPSSADLAKEHANVRQTKEAWANTFKVAIENAKSVAELDGLRKTNRAELMASDLPEVTRDYFFDLIEARKEALS